MKFMLIRIGMGAIWVYSAYKWGDWKNFKKYYPTMLFFGMGDLIYNVVFFEKPLWRFETNLITHPLNELFVIFTIFFPGVLLFLSKYPKKVLHQILYLAFWVMLYTGIEVATGMIGMIKNYNGWNIWWSVFHNSIQFPLVILHHRKPLFAWVIALAFLVLIMNVFNVPFTVQHR